MIEQIQESDIIEQLNQAPSVRGFFISSVKIIENAVNILIQKIFRNDYLAVQAVINPLLDSSGPLGDLMVRSKLLFGLGVIADDVYHDIETLVHIRNKLNRDGIEYEFTDLTIVDQIEKLNLKQNAGVAQFHDFVSPPDDDVDIEFHRLQVARQQQIIKSSLSLIVVDIYNSLDVESPFRNTAL